MPNDFFQFKQFRINQSDCAMKVTTDGCLFGAVIELLGSERRVLDIGTGTGLLSLMIAQRCAADIVAVEVDDSAAKQAIQNFEASPWHQRLSLYPTQIQTLRAGDVAAPFDLMLSNPPFFKEHLQSGTAKDLALHDDQLPQADLADVVIRWLAPLGVFWVMYPEYEFERFRLLMGLRGFSCTHEITVLNRPNSSVFRKIGAFSKEASGFSSEEIMIRQDNGSYSERFARLLEDYYL